MAIIKWAGGKAQLLEELKQELPEITGTYVEPFVGSGALFLELKPQKAIINDFNRELINLYTCIKANSPRLKKMLLDYEGIYNSLDTMDSKKSFYYEKRAEFNKRIVKGSLRIRDAALFIFLNKACYNGLYRVNRRGAFNVPSGQRKKVSLFNEQEFARTKECLDNAEIMLGDFEIACQGLRSGDFVYFDPPYFDTFDTYQAGGFPEEDHRRLADLFRELTEKGVYCMLSNSDTDFIKELYSDYNMKVVSVKRMINRNGSDRSGTELIVRNY